MRNKIGTLAFAVITATLMLASCGKDSDSSSESADYSDSYQFSVNGCDTEKHSFRADNSEDLKNQLCAALQDSTLNNGCAISARRQYFDIKCTGRTWNPN